MPYSPNENIGWGFAVTLGLVFIGLATAITYVFHERGGNGGLVFGLVWFGGLALIFAWFWFSGRKTP